MPITPSESVFLSDDAPHLLIVDDDQRIRELLFRYLLAHGYRVSSAATAGDARAALRNFTFDLIVLDVMLPGETGFEFVQNIRQHSQIPILMLTARTNIEDRMHGFEQGADDYLSKPFDPGELRLRIASILRRVHKAPQKTTIGRVHFGAFTFHLQRGELWKQDQLIRLTEREREMLGILASAPNQIFSREALGDNSIPGDLPQERAQERTVDVQVNRLRRKLEQNPSNPLYLQTVRGLGYRLLVDRLENI